MLNYVVNLWNASLSHINLQAIEFSGMFNVESFLTVKAVMRLMDGLLKAYRSTRFVTSSSLRFQIGHPSMYCTVIIPMLLR